ncbi:hypothetical protein EDD37DRAFT_371440 [Exophiala viscosa]|uniref:uncharacterized protein n=1 Tax=Exophiala viscosa TaxID=2486360 RepID=UPI00218D6BB0|nr:hypothetical protein EDD37DRAFT_371440 [Exophiala viscosa]
MIRMRCLPRRPVSPCLNDAHDLPLYLLLVSSNLWSAGPPEAALPQRARTCNLFSSSWSITRSASVQGSRPISLPLSSLQTHSWVRKKVDHLDVVLCLLEALALGAIDCRVGDITTARPEGGGQRHRRRENVDKLAAGSAPFLLSFHPLSLIFMLQDLHQF